MANSGKISNWYTALVRSKGAQSDVRTSMVGFDRV